MKYLTFGSSTQALCVYRHSLVKILNNVVTHSHYNNYMVYAS